MSKRLMTILDLELTLTVLSFVLILTIQIQKVIEILCQYRISLFGFWFL